MMSAPRSLALALLLAACGPPPVDTGDGGPPPTDIAAHDEAPPPGDIAQAACTFPSGRQCRGYSGGTTCPSDDGCNWCGCGAGWSFSSTAACTLVACNSDAGARPDGAPTWPRCRDQADCPSGFACIFDPGCAEQQGRCNSMVFYCPHDNATYTVCGCDGKTATFTSLGCGPDRRYAYAGACK